MEKPASEALHRFPAQPRGTPAAGAGLPGPVGDGGDLNLARPASGHLYFSLKDEQAQVRCALFRGAARSLRFLPDNGQQVLVRAGSVSTRRVASTSSSSSTWSPRATGCCCAGWRS
ncbi:MAG: exodeoxyribonuclease VII large subunit [Rhodocyclaceae bacterium]|nr:exodeoxyribonuclease VII large subunit [Rhodocyclaceae bacterium]